MPAFVILSEAKNLMDSGTYTPEILRLTPQNDVVGQPLNPPLQKGDFYYPVSRKYSLAPLLKGGVGGFLRFDPVYLRHLRESFCTYSFWAGTETRATLDICEERICFSPSTGREGCDVAE